MDWMGRKWIFGTRGERLQENDGDGKGAFRLHAIAPEAGTDRGTAGFGDVPWRTRLGLLRVGHVRRGLVADANGVEGDEGGV